MHLISLKSLTPVQLLPATTVYRRVRTGRLGPTTTHPRFTHSRYLSSYTTTIPAVSCRFASDVRGIDYVPFVGDTIIIDGFAHADVTRPDFIAPSITKHAEMLFNRRDSFTASPIVSNELTLFAHGDGAGTWGHWVVQYVPRIILFHRAFPDARIALPKGFFVGRPNFGAMLIALGIPYDRFLLFEHNQPYLLRRAAFVDQLYVQQTAHPWAIDLFNEIPSTGTVSKSLFVKRARNTGRNIINDDDITNSAVSFGFDPIELGSESLTNQVNAWRGAERVLTVLGSDLTNLVFTQSGTQLLVLGPATHPDDFFLDLAAAKNAEWNELLCDDVELDPAKPPNKSGFRISPETFALFVESVGR